MGPGQDWAGSPAWPKNDIVTQHVMRIDGAASSTLRKFNSLEDIEHLKYDLTNLVYYLRFEAAACIIGVGGGRDIQSAILFGLDRIDGVDVNPIFIDLLQNEFRDFAGIAGRDAWCFTLMKRAVFSQEAKATIQSLRCH